MSFRSGPIGILTRGVPSTRLQPIFEALAALDVTADPVVFDDHLVEAVRDQLMTLNGVLVWVDPITGEKDRSVLDALLRDVASAGVWVSAHPDVILKMGTKEVLFRTRAIGWGGDTYLYETMDQFAHEFPPRLVLAGPRVVKQNRGNGGIGVWKVELANSSANNAPRADATIRVQHAHPRDTIIEEVRLGDFMARCSNYFSGEGRIVDQRFEPRITEGMIRCYMVGTEVAGFSTQSPHGRGSPSTNVFGLPATKTMFDASEPRFGRLRALMESDWVPAMQRLVDVDDNSLPLLWDADFLLGARTEDGDDSYVLCEINVSCVTPFPPSVVGTLTAAIASRHSSRAY